MEGSNKSFQRFQEESLNVRQNKGIPRLLDELIPPEKELNEMAETSNSACALM